MAEAINVNLDHHLEITLWRTGTFSLSSTTIDDLVLKSSTVDFALFVFTPDDVAVIRNQAKAVARDNVLFELGLFIGAIGKGRSFIVKPRDVELHLPTDLLGLNAADYESNRSDGDIASATNRACSLIRTEVESKGLLERGSKKVALHAPNPPSYDLSATDFAVLGACLETHTSYIKGMSLGHMRQQLRKVSAPAVSLGLIKLERLGYVEKTIENDEQDGYEYYGYKITEDGIDVLLKNESMLSQRAPPIAFDEDGIPF